MTSPEKQKKVPKNWYKNVRISRQIQWFIDYEMVRTNLNNKKNKEIIIFYY